MTIRNLSYMFNPRSIAILGEDGADEDPDTLLELNLIKAGFKGPVMPVNPDRRAVAGVLAYKDIASLPEVPDLAIVTRSLDKAPALIGELGARGVRAAMLVNRERLKTRLDQGGALKQAILDAAKPHLLRLLGPDRLGMAVLANGVNATLSRIPPIPGNIAVLTQSSAIMQAIMNWAHRRNIGFSHMVSMGARIDVDFSDMLDYLAQDHHARSILMYVERIRDPRKFMSAARIAARIKPVIVLKPRGYGEDQVEDAIYDAAFRRAGLLRVDTIERLFNTVETLAIAKPINQNRLVIMGNSRSIGLLTSDTLRGMGGALAAIGADTQTALAALVPPGSHTDNPVDLGDRAGFEQYDAALALLLKEPGVDGVLIAHVPASPDRDMACAKAIVERAAKSRRMVLTSWIGAPSTDAARDMFRQARIATYSTPDEAALAFVRLTQYRHNQELLMETPASVPEEFTPATETARRIVDTALAAGRDDLTAIEVNGLLAAYEIPVLTTGYAATPEEAAEASKQFQQGVALKIVSSDIKEKSDVGGVALALDHPDEVFGAATAMLRRVRALAPDAEIDGFAIQPMLSRHGAYEVVIGVRTGRHFGGGPVLYFGHGGPETQVINDMAYALPPLNMLLARDLMSRTRIYAMLSQSAGRPADLDALALTLIKVSQIVVDLGEIVEMDINPLWATAQGVLALDARIRIAATAGPGTERLAIRPYPKQLEQRFELPDGRTLYLRPILPEDEPSLRDMVRRMPEEDVRLRFFQPIKELSHDMAARLTQLDYDREMAFVVTDSGVAGQAPIWGVVRMNAEPDMEKAEYAIAIDRNMTGLGLGPMLMRRIIDYARLRGFKELFGLVLRENDSMLRLCQALGFTVKVMPDDPGVMEVALKLV